MSNEIIKLEIKLRLKIKINKKSNEGRKTK